MSTLPRLLDCKTLAAELGVTEAAALKIMRHIPKVQVSGLRKVYVRHADVEEFLRRSTKA